MKKTKVKYTPGPWMAIKQRGKYVGNYCIGRKEDHGKGPLVTCISIQGPKDIVPPEYGVSAEANANLVAAAPDLLDACIEAQKWFGEPPKGDDSASPYFREITRLTRILKSAIDKATGEEHEQF